MSKSAVRQSIDAERAAVEAFVFSEGPATVDMGSYRAATDRAVRNMEVVLQAAIDLLDNRDTGSWESEGQAFDALRNAVAEARDA